MSSCFRWLTVLASIFWLLYLTSFLGHAQMFSLSHEAFDRTYLLHVPLGYDGIEKLPLVIAMHGGFGSARNLQNQSQLSVLADEQGFMVVYPEGVAGGILNIRTWNAGTCCGFSQNENIDDVGFIDALIDQLLSEYAIDTQRIYATGMSNGGMMSYRLACELSHRIAAIAPVACAMVAESCDPSHAMPIIHFHSYLDSSVLHDGGVGIGIGMVASEPHLDIFNRWSDINQCNITLDTLEYSDKLTHIQWADGLCDSEIQYYLTQDGGHSWPGGNATPTGDPVSEQLNASHLMWHFFSQHTLDCRMSTSSHTTNKTTLDIYPTISPNGHFEITAFKGGRLSSAQVIDHLGRHTDFELNSATLTIFSKQRGIYLFQYVHEGRREVHRLIIF